MESCVPPGFRFHPTDEELVGYYLRKKVALQKIDLDVIKEIDLYRIEPWDLQDKCGIGYEEQKEWYFFSHKDKKYPTGTRTNRATMAGFWKATGRDKAVYDKNKLIGMRKTLVFYKGRAPNGNKTDWIMHEYRLESEENGPSQEEGWVVCRAFKKRKISSQIKSTNVEGYYYGHESFGIGSVIFDSIDNITTKQRWQQQQQPPQNLECKQETEAAENLHLVQCSDQFIQLPELESPSLTVPMTKHTNYSTSEINSSEKHINDLDDKKTVRDWRDLDKFVASQLSHEDAYEGDRVSDLELLLLENGKEEVLFTTPTSDCDILEFACLINE